MSEDEKIEFTVDADNRATGEITLESETVKFFLDNDTGSGMHLFPIEVLDNSVIDTNDEQEYWICTYHSKREFTAIVKKTTFFNVGERIKFHRIDD